MHPEKNVKKRVAFVETPSTIADVMVSLISDSKKEDKGISILDTGCGNGIFLESLQTMNYTNLEGIEIDSKLYELSLKKIVNVKLYNEDFLDWKNDLEYDVIIGNPPYAHYNSLPAEIQPKVKNIVKGRESDIYYAFIIKSIDLLKEGGELIYIVPYGFFYNTYAKIVREKIITNGYFEILIDLDEVRLFEGENPETIIFKFVKKKEKKENSMKVLRILNKNLPVHEIPKYAQDSIENQRKNDVFDYFEKPMYANAEEIWTTFPEIKIENYVLLKDVAWVGVGPVSGFDEAFRLNENEECKFSDTENNLIIRTIKAVNCVGYWTEDLTNYILLDRAIKSEKELVESFPNIAQKIMKFKEKMKSRYLPGKMLWFQWQALRNMKEYKEFAGRYKIFIPTLDRSKTNRFSMSDEFLYASGDVLAIIPLDIDPHFLVGYLNSNFFRDYYFSAGARRGHRIAYTQKIMSNIRIPVFPKRTIAEISQIVKDLIRTRNLTLRAKIDEIIMKNLP